MKRTLIRLTTTFSIGIALLLVGQSAVRAHHAFEAEYDANKPITITGFVTKIEWVNPHAYVSIDTKDESGAVKTYKVEMGPPYALVRGGWKRDTLKIGDKVTVEGAGLAKNGSDAAGAMPTTMMVLANGQRLVMR